MERPLQWGSIPCHQAQEWACTPKHWKKKKILTPWDILSQKYPLKMPWNAWSLEIIIMFVYQGGSWYDIWYMKIRGKIVEECSLLLSCGSEMEHISFGLVTGLCLLRHLAGPQVFLMDISDFIEVAFLHSHYTYCLVWFLGNPSIPKMRLSVVPLKLVSSPWLSVLPPCGSGSISEFFVLFHWPINPTVT